MSRPAKLNPARNLHSVLSQTAGFGELAGRIQAMVDVQSALQTQWPALGLQVLSIRQGVLTVRTTSAALAAKARQSEPSILAVVRRLQPQVQQVRFKAQKTGLRSAPQAPSDRNRDIAPEALEQLQMTASQMQDGPVRNALKRLIKRQLS